MYFSFLFGILLGLAAPFSHDIPIAPEPQFLFGILLGLAAPFSHDIPVAPESHSYLEFC